MWSELYFMIVLFFFFYLSDRSGSSVEKWRVEFTSTTDCHPVKLACQLTANNLLDASSAGT
jgi:hypothetical protein